MVTDLQNLHELAQKNAFQHNQEILSNIELNYQLYSFAKYNLGKIYLDKGEWLEAIKHFNAALQTQNNSNTPNKDYQIAIYEGISQAALGLFQTNHNDTLIELIASCGDECFELKDFKAADKCYERILFSNSGNPNIREMLSYINNKLVAIGMHNEAAKYSENQNDQKLLPGFSELSKSLTSLTPHELTPHKVGCSGADSISYDYTADQQN